MPSTDPWFDWYITYGAFPPEFPVPPDLSEFTGGQQVTEDEQGNPNIPWPFPPPPAGAPECFNSWKSQTENHLASIYASARSNCFQGPLYFRWFGRFGGGQRPYYFGYFPAPYDDDQCAGDSIDYPSDCPFLDDFLAGWNLANCPQDYQLRPSVQPGLHRIVQEILRPSDSPFIFRVGFDNNLAVLLFDSDVLQEGECASYALGIGLQIEALMEACSQIITTDYRVVLQAKPYYDGILWGIRFKIKAVDSQNETYAIIGYNRLLETGFCGRQRIFAEDVGASSCESEEDDMGCECEQIEQIIDAKLSQIKDDYLVPIKDKTNDLHGLFLPYQEKIKDFLGAGQQSWTRFLQIFSYCWAYIRPSGTDDDEIILPSLSDRIKDNFERVKSRQRTIYSTIPRLMRVNVTPTISGEKNTSRDTYIIGDRNVSQQVGYNHYGQIWLEIVYTSGVEVTTNWRWIRSRDATITYWLPDQRVGETDQITIRPKWQLFPSLIMTSVTVDIALQAFADLTSPIWVPEQDQGPRPN